MSNRIRALVVWDDTVRLTLVVAVCMTTSSVVETSDTGSAEDVGEVPASTGVDVSAERGGRVLPSEG